MNRALSIAQRGLKAIAEILFNAVLWVVLLLVGGAALVLFGVHMMLGLAWAAVLAGILCFAVAAIVVMGVRHA